MSDSADYLVVPFTARVDSTGPQAQDQIAHQLARTIQHHADQGWEYLRLEQVTVQVSPGCLSSLLGQKAGVLTSDQLVFRR